MPQPEEQTLHKGPRPRSAVLGPSALPALWHWVGRHRLDQQRPARSGARQQQGRLATGRGVASGGATEGGRPAARISEATSTSLLQINQQPWSFTVAYWFATLISMA